MKINLKYSFVLIIVFLISSCKNKPPVIENLSNRNITLVNQDKNEIDFAKMITGNISVVGFIFTHCPDICPLTINNMQRIQKELKKDNINDIEFIAITFDPERDTPDVLKEFAEIRNIDFTHWNLLTGSVNQIDSIKNAFRIMAVAEDTSYSDDGKPYYFFVHTDRISLIDTQGNLRKNYSGSNINVEEIVNDIKSIR